MHSSLDSTGKDGADTPADDGGMIACRSYCDAIGALLDNEPYCVAAGPLMSAALAGSGSSLAVLCVALPDGLRLVGLDGTDPDRALEPDFWREASQGIARDGHFDIAGYDHLLGVPMRTGDVVIVNTRTSDARYGIVPGRRAPVASFLGVPLRRGNEDVGLFALANAPAGYTPELVERLAPLIMAGGVICAAYRSDQQVARLEHQFVEARRLESLGKLAGGVAHEFNNLLQVLLGSTDALLREIPEGHPNRPDLDAMRRTAEKGMLLSRQLLGYTGRRPEEVRDVNVNVLLEETGQMLERVIREDIRVVMLLNPALGTTAADPAQLQQVILDLAASASAAMPQGGRLTIRTANLRFDAHSSTSRPPGLVPGSYVILTVSNSGAGHRGDPVGTPPPQENDIPAGIGVAQTIVREFGGEVVADSHGNRGTRVTIYLPRSGENDATQVLELEEPEPSACTGETVLVAEDEDAVRSLTQRVLERHHYRVLTARNGVEALEVAAAHPDKIHLLLTDVIMPEMGGKDLAQRLYVTHPEVAVVYMSGYTGTAIQRAGVRRLGNYYLQKPFHSSDLLRMVRSALDGEPPCHA